MYQLLFVLVIAFIARMVVSYFSSKINYSYIPQKSIYAQNEFVKDFYLKGTFVLLKNAPSYLHDRVNNDIEEYIKYYYSTIPFIIGECTLIIYVSVFVYGLSFIFFVIFVVLMIIYLLIHRFSQFRLIDLEYRSIELGNRLFPQRNNLYHRLIEIKSKENMRVEYQRLNHLSIKLNVLINKNFISKYFISSSKIFFYHTGNVFCNRWGDDFCW
ncbi:MAG TPA: hypothetical protein K8W13_04825 [Enterococcus columbae]|nr:hypothetical protein [Enterococcus columbae]